MQFNNVLRYIHGSRLKLLRKHKKTYDNVASSPDDLHTKNVPSRNTRKWFETDEQARTPHEHVIMSTNDIWHSTLFCMKCTEIARTCWNFTKFSNILKCCEIILEYLRASAWKSLTSHEHAEHHYKIYKISMTIVDRRPSTCSGLKFTKITTILETDILKLQTTNFRTSMLFKTKFMDVTWTCWESTRR